MSIPGESQEAPEKKVKSPQQNKPKESVQKGRKIFLRLSAFVYLSHNAVLLTISTEELNDLLVFFSMSLRFNRVCESSTKGLLSTNNTHQKALQHLKAPHSQQKKRAPHHLFQEMVLLPLPVHSEQLRKRFLTCTKNGIWHGPEHRSRIAELSSQRKQQMTNVTWKAGCPVLMTDLQTVHFTHWQLDGSIRWERSLLPEKVAAGVQEIFAQLYAIGYPITSAKPMLYFNGKDDESMAANNTSAFNCRRVKGSKRYSQHSTGEAIDLNPLWDPWVKGTRVDPPTAREFANRELDHPGLIKPNDQIVSLFQSTDGNGVGIGEPQRTISTSQPQATERFQMTMILNRINVSHVQLSCNLSTPEEL